MPPVPSTLSSFVGRERELSTMLAAFRVGARLVTILGPPGVGKTRLARELLARSGHPCPVWLELADAGEPGDVDARVARALGIAGDEDVVSALAASGPLLVACDNFEHLARTAGVRLVGWLAAAPELTIVVTSRLRLDVEGEVVIDLAPLPLPGAGEAPDAADSVRLFLDRAAAVRAGHRPDETELAAIATLVRRLDGIPLAIEMAAAHVRHMSPLQMSQEVTRRMEMLRVSAPRGRWSTMHAAIQWSWEQLAPWEQEALVQCLVFRGGFSVEAAAEILDLGHHAGAPPVLEVLKSLCDHSLLRCYDVPELPAARRLDLYVPVADFARERYNELPLCNRIIERHAAYYVNRRAQWIHRMDVHDDPVASLEHAEALANLLALYRRRRFERAPHDERAVAVFRRLDDRRCLALALALVGLLSDESGELDRAWDELSEACTLLERLDMPGILGTCQIHQAGCAARRGDLDAARGLFLDAISSMRTAGGAALEALSRAHIAAIDRQEGRDEAALAGFAAAIARLPGSGAAPYRRAIEVLAGRATLADHPEDRHRMVLRARSFVEHLRAQGADPAPADPVVAVASEGTWLETRSGRRHCLARRTGAAPPGPRACPGAGPRPLGTPGDGGLARGAPASCDRAPAGPHGDLAAQAMGLRDSLVTSEAGYALDPALHRRGDDERGVFEHDPAEGVLTAIAGR